MEFPTIDKFAKEVAEKALNEITYEGKTIREWAEIIAKQQPCEDCISRQALLDKLEKPMNWTDSDAEIQEQRDYEGFVELLKSMPSVIPQRQKGRWIQQEDIHKHHYGWLFCSECGAFLISSDGANYCSCCGAEMEADE